LRIGSAKRAGHRRIIAPTFRPSLDFGRSFRKNGPRGNGPCGDGHVHHAQHRRHSKATDGVDIHGPLLKGIDGGFYGIITSIEDHDRCTGGASTGTVEVVTPDRTLSSNVLFRVIP
jgi:hypothetical protein